MEARIVKIEATMDHVGRDVGILVGEMKNTRERLSGLEVKVDHLPGKGFVVSAALGIVSALAAIILFADQIRALAGA